jgi:predicted secreted Zn-dependent protease
MLRALLLSICMLTFGTASASADEIVRYRLTQWKRQHLHDAAKAQKIMDTLTKLGCEMEKSDHNGHIDVKYRCPEWKQLDLDSHEEAHKWETWLKQFKFETEHKH